MASPRAVAAQSSPTPPEPPPALVPAQAGVPLPQPTTSGVAEVPEGPAPAVEPNSASYGASARVGAPQQATSSYNLVGRRLRLAPHTTAGDLLNGVPGVLAVQHAGGGKANQYFLRGFDADHGSDIAFLVDDVPINVVSHAHGQGYSELQFIPADAIKTVEVRKGPYYSEYGDQATAGAIHFKLEDVPAEQRAYVQGGSFGTFRSAALLSPDLGGARPLLALDWYQNRGPYRVAEDTRRFSSLFKLSHRLGDAGSLTLTAMEYGSSWNAPGQIPRRAVSSGLSRFGSIDTHEGGNARRDVLSLRYAVEAGPARFAWTSYVQRYALALYSNFGFFTDNPTAGDMIRQGDERTIYGTRARYSHKLSYGAMRSELSAGFQLRQDEALTSVDHAPGRVTDTRLLRSRVRERGVGAFAEADTRLGSYVRLVLGARADRITFVARDLLASSAAPDLGSGERSRALLSPKASLIVHTPLDLDLFSNFGSGFRSNDARGVVSRVGPRADPMTRALGYELGVRQALFSERLTFALTAYQLDLSSEAVFVGDSGQIEQRGRTRRRGLEAHLTARPLPWLLIDLDAGYSRAAFVANAGNADAVALAPRWLGQGSVTAEHPMGVRARLSTIIVGKRPANEDASLTATGFTRVDAGVEYTYRHLLLGLSVQNLLNAAYAQAQFASVTRLQGETTPADCRGGSQAAVEDGEFRGCEDVNGVAGAPLTVLASVGVLY
jgi:outer membrane receptor protein involved in Fe transport